MDKQVYISLLIIHGKLFGPAAEAFCAQLSFL